jgi:hypothetical protein
MQPPYNTTVCSEKRTQKKIETLNAFVKKNYEQM